VVVVVLVLLLAVAHNSAAVTGGVIAVGIMILILGVELPLIMRGQRRRQEILMNSLPNGAFYSGRASLYPPHGVRGLPTTGTILFDRAGVKFNPKKDGASPTTITWDSVIRIELAPAPGKIGVGRLALSLAGGQKRVLTVPNFRSMEEILRSHP
jgi:hypothetical protein